MMVVKSEKRENGKGLKSYVMVVATVTFVIFIP